MGKKSGGVRFLRGKGERQRRQSSEERGGAVYVKGKERKEAKSTSIPEKK